MTQELSRAEILGGLLQRIGNYDPSDFSFEYNDRLILQKTIYLMQEFGIYIGYNFNWYLRGPYSPSLSNDAFDIMNKYEQLPTIEFISKETERRFEKFLTFIGERRDDQEWLEAAASIHFLIKYNGISDRDAIWRRVKGKMPDLRKAIFNQCWSDLKKAGLIEVE